MARLPVDINVAVEGADKISDATGRLDGLQKGALVVGGAMLGAAGAIEGFNRVQQDANVQVGRLSISTGMQTKEIRDLATQTSNATFPLNEVLDLFELGSKRGVEGGEALKTYAGFWDMVGDASGINSKILAEGAVALEVLGIGIDNQNDLLPAYGYLLKNTTIGLDEFNAGIAKQAPKLDEMGLSVDNAAAILGILEGKGITGKKAMAEFGGAVQGSDGDMGTLLATLGISEAQFQAVSGEVANSGGHIEALAQNFYDSRTSLQHLQSGFDDFMFQNAELAQALDFVVPALGGVGMGLMGISTVGPMAVSAFSNVTGGIAKLVAGIGPAIAAIAAKAAAWWAVAAAVIAANAPLIAIVAIIAALVAAVVWAYNNVEWFRDLVDQAFKFVGQVVGQVVEFIKGVLAGLQPAFRAIGDVIGVVVNLIVGLFNLWLSAVRTVINLIIGVINALRPAFDAIVSVIRTAIDIIVGVFNLWVKGIQTYIGVVVSVLNSLRPVFDAIVGIIRTAIDIVLGVFRGLAAGIGSVINGVVGFLRGAINGAIGIFQGLLSGIVTIGRSIMDFVGGIFKPLSDGFNTAVSFVKGLWNGFARFWNSIGIKIPSIDIPFIGVVGGFEIGLPKLPMLAKGGIVSGPTLALLGEAGPEAVVPLDRQFGNSYDITVQTGVGDPVAIGRSVVAAIEEFERASGRRWRTSEAGA